MNKKKIILFVIITILVVLSIIGIIFIINKTSKKEVIDILHEKNIETGERFKEERKYKELDVNNIEYVYNGEMKMFRADFTNNTDKKTEREDINIVLLDENNNELQRIYALLLEVEPGETTGVTVGVDIENPYDFRIEKN